MYTSAIGTALGVANRDHIAITALVDLLPLSVKKWVHILGLLLIGVLNGFMVVLSIPWIEKVGHFPWQPLGWSQAIILAAIPIGCSLAILFCLIRIMLTLSNQEDLHRLWMRED